MKKKLKLYVWEGVFSDYTDGIAFALATSPDHARKLIGKNRAKMFGSDPNFWMEDTLKELQAEPLVITRACGFHQSGGG